ncbi:Granaticin polyketide synthase putative ketoacyl reductase 2 (ORF6) [Durusdinium trenchii]|uniref:Granaticin polyketide synthase putative ketoacyl reductase 2 (ORF6) n=1 Tax=Durusdinium trenchii TaxID=1381693 RepID=A0ABP0KRV9_9DINO
MNVCIHSRGEERPRVALITGSSSGIGKAIAERLAAEGFLVVVNSHSSVEDGKAVAAELPGAMYIQADCSTRQGCEALVKEVIDRCGQLDLLVCNAGVGKWIPHDNLELIDDAYLHKIFEPWLENLVSEAQKSLAQYGPDGFPGPLPPDFIVTVRMPEKSDPNPRNLGWTGLRSSTASSTKVA